MTPTTDALLDRRYQLGELIARGGMGEVWQAHDLVLARTVAVKVLRTALVDDPTFQARFRAEARHAARLTYPGIAQVFDYGEEPGLAYLVMELVPGESLSALLKRGGRVSVDRTLTFIAQAAAALQAAHDAGVVHRDVKPGNLLITPDDQVKITDFGISRATGDAAGLTAAGQVLGTAYYLSPEQARGRRVGPASDIYALGVVAYECLAGRRPFGGSNPTMIALAQVRDEPPPLPVDVPDSVRALVARMLAKEPASRPSSAGEVALAAAALRSGYANVVQPPRSATASDTAAAPSRSSSPSPMARTETLPAIDVVPEARPVRRFVVIGVITAIALICGITITASVWAAGDDRPANPAGLAAGPAEASATNTAESVVSPPAKQTVELDPADFVGRPFVAVRNSLIALGLQARRENSAARGMPGTVTGIAPDGQVEVGSTVTVFVIERGKRENEPSWKKGSQNDHD
jgi:serine/threonine-protein kinase